MGVQLTLNDIQSGFLSASAFNANNDLIEQAFADALSRKPSANNAMETNLDMGLNNVFNLKKAALSHEAVNLRQVFDIIAASSSDITSRIDAEDRYIANSGDQSIEFENISYIQGTNSLLVFVNGVYQRANIDYLEDSGTSIQFVSALEQDDVVDIFGSRYDAKAFVELAITAADSAEQSAASASQDAQTASDAADQATQAAGYKLEVNDQVGTAYTLELNDEGDFIRMDNPAANTVTVPTNFDVAFEIGTVILIRQINDGVTTVSPAIGVTINAPFNSYDISEADFGVALVKVDTDEWDLVKAFGGVETSDLVAFSQEFDARLEDFYKEILSSDPTFVVNFDQLQNNVNSAITQLQSEFDTLEQNTTTLSNSLQTNFNQLDSDFNAIDSQFTTIQNDFNTIESDFNSIDSDFTTIQNNFTTIQSDFTDISNRFDTFEQTLDDLNIEQGFDSSFAETGYQYIASGLIMQWGRTGLLSIDDTITVNFPVTFPNAALNMQVTPEVNSTGDQDTIGRIVNYDTNSALIKSEFTGGKQSVTARLNWFVIGY